MRANAWASHISRIVLLGSLLMAAASCAAARTNEALADTPEWRRLTRLWQVLLDHSSGQVFNAAIFQGLAKDMYEAEADLQALAARGNLRRSVADYLESVFHLRYQYLADYCYTTRSTVQASPYEASRQAALWVVELQLSLLRKPVLSRSDEELARTAESNLAYQLTYLYHIGRLESQIEQRRSEMARREAAGGKVDWEGFERDVERRRNLLLDAWKARRLPRAGVVHEAAPYLVALTRSSDRPSAEARLGP